MALDAAAQDGARSADRLHRPDEVVGHQSRESWVLARAALARARADDGSRGCRHRLLVQHAEVSRAARAEGGREHRIAPRVGKARYARRGDRGARLRLWTDARRDLGSHSRGVESPPVRLKPDTTY